MKSGKPTQPALLISFILMAVGLLIIQSCNPRSGRSYYTKNGQPNALGYVGEYSSGMPPAHGGTNTPNDQAYDAMFFETHGVNPFIDTEDDRLSTFAIDVDTASYSITRSYIFDGYLPPKEAVRVEEFVNYFKYDYREPKREAFSINLAGTSSKFGGPNYKLLRVGLKGKDVEPAERKDAILTFVIDVSGSMSSGNRLGLVKRSLRLLVDELNERDKVGIVVYGSRAKVIMKHRSIEDRKKILAAIDRLKPEGSTNAEEGLNKGYELAAEAFTEGAINRVVLCSDGVANVGTTGADGILAGIKEHASKGITLSTIGFGMGNYNDILMEKLADKGDGNYAYVDNFDEAKRVFRENLTSVLQVIAKDVKVQVEFNPEVVSRYRLLGYENRRVKDEDFRDDEVDGGEVGAGHQVTALYEIKFQKNITPGHVATVTMRYKEPGQYGNIVELSRPIEMKDFSESFDETAPDLKLAAAVAEFSEILRKSYWAQDSSIETVLDTLHNLPEEYRKKPEVTELMDLASKALKLQK